VQDMLGVALTLGRLRFEDAHDDHVLRSEPVRRLRRLVEVVRDEGLGEDAASRRASWVEIETSDGAVRRGRVHIAPGHWELGGMPWPDLDDKFAGLAEQRLPAAASETVRATVRDLEHHTTLRDLGAALAAGR
jgi:2-methylcitrate dehydratase PrpD